MLYPSAHLRCGRSEPPQLATQMPKRERPPAMRQGAFCIFRRRDQVFGPLVVLITKVSEMSYVYVLLKFLIS